MHVIPINVDQISMGNICALYQGLMDDYNIDVVDESVYNQSNM